MDEFKPLGAEETIALLKKAKEGDEVAKERLLQGNFPLIKSIVKAYQNKGVDYDDLYQIGSMGFLKAINNFDESFGVKFSTYAVPMISGEIKRFLRDDGAIKVSRAIKTLWLKIKAYTDECEKKGETAPSIEDLAKHFQVDAGDIVYAMDASRMLVSLDAQLDENSTNSQSVIDRVVLEDKSDLILDKILLKQAIQDLQDREKKIILLRYYRSKTQSEVALILGISQVQVSRLETKIIEKLKNRIK
ncbi:MAG: SigB/SigF/SigG family RNA polymerase sigma factor [Clostridia bacterium]|nr:SigB/SigF/SigG family RNA polymerase sigma factor [Clostridia bacterium]